MCVLRKTMGLSKHKIGFLEMQIHSLPRGGALRAAAEIKRSVHPVTAVNKAALRSKTLLHQAFIGKII